MAISNATRSPPHCLMVTFLSCPKMLNIVIKFCLSQFSMLFLSFADFVQNMFFLKMIFQKYIQLQTVWIQIMTDILSGLIRVQNVCKGYIHQQTASGATDRQTVTVLPAKSDSDTMFRLQSYPGLIIDRSLVY